MMPISWGIDNRAAAGVIDGVGGARAQIRARKGAEPGVASQYHMWDDIRKDGLTVMYMPLQLPHEDSGLNRSPLTNTKGLVQLLKGEGDPLKNPNVWLVDPDSNVRLKEQPSGNKPNRLFYVEKGKSESQQLKYDAEQFTMALMFASLSTRLKDYAHMLNVEKPHIKDQKIERVPFRSDEGGYYYVMMCSFILKSLHKDQQIDGALRDELERILTGDRPNPQTKPAQSPPPTRQQNVGSTTGSLPGTSTSTVTA